MTKLIFNFGSGDVEIEGVEGVYKEIKLQENEFSTENWWRVTAISDDTYIFFCLSGGHGGGECTVQITRDEYKKPLSLKDFLADL